MKIFNLKIISPYGKVVRDLDFAKMGISIVLGDIKKQDDPKGTINSLGKTLLLKMVDYLFGANDDKTFFKKDICGYTIKGNICFRGTNYKCSREIGDSSKNFIDGKVYSLSEYKSFFSINRGFLGKQVFFEEKSSLISPRSQANVDDYINFLTLLKLERFSEKVWQIYSLQDKMKELKKNGRLLTEAYGQVKPSKLEEEIFLVDKRVEEYEGELADVTKKIENIQVSDLKKDVVGEYANRNREYKETVRGMELATIEKERLLKFIEDTKGNKITSDDVLRIYKRAKMEIPEAIKKELQEVQAFHEKVYLERVEYLAAKVLEVEREYKKLMAKSEVLAKELDRLGKMISENEAYKEAIFYYEDFTKKLTEQKYKQGQLSQLKSNLEAIAGCDKQLTRYFETAKDLLKGEQEIIREYREFIFKLVKLIYSDDVIAFFEVGVKDKHATRRPVSVELTLSGDTGEGVGNVRKLLIDYLVFYYNEELDILIQDSSCYNGIDPRQVTSMLTKLDLLAKEVNKQAIVSLNRYQLTADEETDLFLKQNSSLVLSEQEYLLGFKF